jgi:hypothetical protein
MQFELMFLTSRDLTLECFLHTGIKKTIPKHVLIKAMFDDGGEDLTNAGCQGNWSEVLRVGGVFSGLGFGNQFNHSLFPSLGDYPLM